MAITLQFSSAPYPGLRPFRNDESDVFFGRERQIDQLLEYLARNRFLAITGSSGCGKSSLVRAGMIPALQAGFMAEVGSRWRICVLRPGEGPIRQLAQALASPEILGVDRADESAAAHVEAALRRGPLGLIEVVRGAEALKGATLLVLVDQFEEMFRYRERIAADEADAFVALLLASAGQAEVPIYVVITMRSDYLGQCAVFHGLAEAVSTSQYLTPRLTREELDLAITGPARVFGGRVEPKLLNRLLNDFSMTQDELPLLQHVLARLWTRCSAATPTPVLTVEDYEAVGGLAEALSIHGDEILAELTQEQQRIAEIMFRRLSGSEDGKHDVRCPARVNEVAKIAGVDPRDVIAVAEAFRSSDRCFLAASDVAIRDDTMLDISHESLIRQWHRLAGWVDDEAKSAEIYRRLMDWALRWEHGDAELWRGPNLANALAWREREAPNAEWAERYGDRDQFKCTMRFLEASEEARRLEINAEAELRQRQLRRLRRAVLGLGLATASLMAAILVYWVVEVREYDTYYTSYTDRRDVPQGVGNPLSTSEVQHHSASYKITRRGTPNGSVVRMERVDEQGKPRDMVGTVDAMISPGGGASDRFSRWDFVYDATGRLAYKGYFDRSGKYIESEIFPPGDAGSNGSRYVYNIGQDGSLAQEKGTCVAYSIRDYSPQGYTIQEHFLDQAGNPTPGRKGAYIKRYEYDKQGRRLRNIALWKDGRSMNDDDRSAESRVSYDSAGNQVSDENFDAGGSPVNAGVMNSQRIECRFDDHGNCVAAAMWRADGRQALFGNMGNVRAGLAQSAALSYDGRGNITQTSRLMPDGQLVRSGFASSRLSYDEHDWLTEERYLDRSGRPTVGPLGGTSSTMRYDDDGHMTELAFFDDGGRPTANIDGWHKKNSVFRNGNNIREEYRDDQGKLVAIEGGFAGIERTFDAHGNELRTTFLGVDDAPIINRTEGFAVRNRLLDTCGREIESDFLDEKGNPVRAKEGYARIRKTYNEDNEVAKEEYLDERDRPIRSLKGYAQLIRRFDRNRNIVDERYLDEQGGLIPANGSAAEHITRYDDHNALVEEAFLGPDGEPVLNEFKWARQTRRYDARNGLLEEAYFGIKGEPVLSDEGYARATYTNDIHGLALETAYFGPYNKPIAGQHRYAREVDRRDDHGWIRETSYFGADGLPALNDGGFARKVTDYDEFGRVVGWAYFGIAGEPVIGATELYHRAKLVLDERGNWLETALFGIDDKPMVSTNGFARKTDRYDASNAIIEETYFGTDGEPVLIKDGYARVTFDKDIHGNNRVISYYGTDGRPVISEAGYARDLREYSDYGDLVEESYLDTDGRPALRNGQFAKLVQVHDRYGRITEVSYFGTDGKPTTKNPFGASRFVIAYGQGDHNVERLLYHGGALTEHQRVPDTDPFGSAVESTVTDSSGKLADGPDGYARCSFGKEPQCFDQVGHPLVQVFLVISVAASSPAELAGLHEGDMLAGDPTATPGATEQRTLDVIRAGHHLSVPVPGGRIGITFRKYFVADSEPPAR